MKLPEMLVVERSGQVLAELASLASAENFRIRAATRSPRWAATLARLQPPDVALIALGLNWDRAFRAAEAVLRAAPDAKLVFHVGRLPETAVPPGELEWYLIAHALGLRAVGWVPKTPGQRLLRAALPVILNGGRYFPSRILPAQLAPGKLHWRKVYADGSPRKDRAE